MNECGIINLADSKDLEGTHWTCYFKKEWKVYYFDSYGIQPPIEIVKYLGSNRAFRDGGAELRDGDQGSPLARRGPELNATGIFDPLGSSYDKDPLIHNTFQIQDFNQVVCGHLCLYVLFHLNKGKDFNEIIFSLISNP